MERRAPWFQLVAVVLLVVGLIALAAPSPAHAMDPQLMLALASAAGAIALIVGYLIVANGRDHQRAASLEGIYACSDREASGPMGCGGPTSAAGGAPAAIAAAPESPMVADGRIAPRTDGLAALTHACAAGQVAGPMGCGGSEPVYSASAPTVAPALTTIQGQ
ncbi:MAG: hypothetical protein WEG40_15220 [Candidatus Rokuibacteriota bacterium]